jgi:hypothetical protein
LIGLKDSLPLIAFSDTDIIVSLSSIKLGEVLHPFEVMDRIINEGEGVLIFCMMALSA